MNTRRTAEKRVEEDLVYVGVPNQGNQATPQCNKVPLQHQAPIILPPMTDGEIRSAFVTLAQYMTTNSQSVATQDQSMIAQANKDVGPRVQLNASTMACHLREFTRMNHPMFFGYNVNEYPHVLIDEAYKNFYSMGDIRAVRAYSITWEVLRRDFVDRFFPMERREAKVEDFINLRQRECSAMLLDNMDISQLMVHAQHVEETILKKKNKEFKRVKSYERCTSKGRLEIQGKHRFKNRVSNQVTPNFPKANKDRVPNPRCANSGHSVTDCPYVRSQEKGSVQAQETKEEQLLRSSL
ncbi:hypothetical protein EJD97_005980 [Solanum chilense]|uniref:Retrotransposon gag domain-containing protein n=1 Tax=Solanum chilense TaxID=4083 RepID=A0A6N2AL90_SOLCI|nr:hypothetical protein EJD97_005980 [Solanum chilense]